MAPRWTTNHVLLPRIIGATFLLLSVLSPPLLAASAVPPAQQEQRQQDERQPLPPQSAEQGAPEPAEPAGPVLGFLDDAAASRAAGSNSALQVRQALQQLIGEEALFERLASTKIQSFQEREAARTAGAAVVDVLAENILGGVNDPSSETPADEFLSLSRQFLPVAGAPEASNTLGAGGGGPVGATSAPRTLSREKSSAEEGGYFAGGLNDPASFLERLLERHERRVHSTARLSSTEAEADEESVVVPEDSESAEPEDVDTARTNSAAASEDPESFAEPEDQTDQTGDDDQTDQTDQTDQSSDDEPPTSQGDESGSEDAEDDSDNPSEGKKESDSEKQGADKEEAQKQKEPTALIVYSKMCTSKINFFSKGFLFPQV